MPLHAEPYTHSPPTPGTPFVTLGSQQLARYTVSHYLVLAAADSRTASTGNIHLFPFWSWNGGKVNALAADVVGGSASTTFRLGLYRSVSPRDIYPGDLVAGSDTLSSASTGVRRAQVDCWMEPNRMYWTAIATSSSTPTFQSVTSAVPVLGVGTSDFSGVANHISVSYTYAALPQRCPDGPTFVSGECILIGVEFA